jgi:hypothetical protein
MQNTYILDIRLQELVAAVNEILLEVKTWYWYDAQYITFEQQAILDSGVVFTLQREYLGEVGKISIRSQSGKCIMSILSPLQGILYDTRKETHDVLAQTIVAILKSRKIIPNQEAGTDVKQPTLNGDGQVEPNEYDLAMLALKKRLNQQAIDRYRSIDAPASAAPDAPNEKREPAEPQPWQSIPNNSWDRLAVELLWKGFSDPEIASKVGKDIVPKTVTNRLSDLRGQYPDLVPTREKLKQMSRGKPS